MQQFALIRSSSSLHSEACNALGVSARVIHSRISQAGVSLRASSNSTYNRDWHVLTSLSAFPFLPIAFVLGVTRAPRNLQDNTKKNVICEWANHSHACCAHLICLLAVHQFSTNRDMANVIIELAVKWSLERGVNNLTIVLSTRPPITAFSS